MKLLSSPVGQAVPDGIPALARLVRCVRHSLTYSAVVMVLLTTILVIVDVGWAGGPEGESACKPNVLVILTDQWRAEALECMGSVNVKTPHLDRLAGQGILYRNAFANSPLCSPSRASLLTGRYPATLGMVTNDLAIRWDEVSIAHVLNEQGYRSACIGKWHIEAWPRHQFIPPGPRRLGFDDYWAVCPCAHNYLKAWYFLDEPKPVAIDGYEPDHQTDLAIDFVRRHRSDHPDKPFFLFLSFGPPHAPYELLPDRYKDFYDPREIALRPNCKEEDVDRTVLAQYYAHCTALDENIGRIMAALDESGVADDTIVLFTSDHGDMLWSHGTTKKQQPWDESSNIPLMVRYPKRVEPGQRSDVLISMVDLMPTILGLADVPVPDSVQGTNLSWSMLGEKGEEPDSVYLMELFGIGQVFHHQIHTWRAVRTRRYLYAEDTSGPWLLYDMKNDRFQLRNEVQSPDYEDARRELAAELRSWYTRLGESYQSGVEMARASGRQEEVEALMDVIRHLSRNNPAALDDFNAYLEEGAARPNKRF